VHRPPRASHNRPRGEGAGELGPAPRMDLEERSLDPVTQQNCSECGMRLTEREIQASLDSEGPFLCTVHAAEQVPLDAEA
jgi:hypothetical protein